MAPLDAHEASDSEAFRDSDQEDTPIHFFEEDIAFAVPKPDLLRQWVLETATHEGFEVESLSFIFCSDAHLLGINQQYLEHDTFTDIITFPYHEEAQRIQGDVFISIDRVRENAEAFEAPFIHELHRVIIHGVLHLSGYVDGTEADKAFMRKKEDFYLERRSPALSAQA